MILFGPKKNSRILDSKGKLEIVYYPLIHPLDQRMFTSGIDKTFKAHAIRSATATSFMKQGH